MQQFLQPHMKLHIRPFRHFAVPDFLEPDIADQFLSWLDERAPWSQNTIPGFYEASDVNLKHTSLPSSLEWAASPSCLLELRDLVAKVFERPLDAEVDVRVHRLTPGQQVRVHTDHGELARSHRLLIQLNRGWSPDNGGLLMFLDGDALDDVNGAHALLCPLHRSAMAFEISERSFHAVSPVKTGVRYTLTYTFYKGLC
jgi:Rps23 Pro-64 3,4-dihydroxylase Tpa1-like proline 4-hydroxylase